MPRYVATIKETRDYEAAFFLDPGQDVERLSDRDILRRLAPDWDEDPYHIETHVVDVRRSDD
jgi:hypothetical protein